MTELNIDVKSTALLVLHVAVKNVDGQVPSEKNKILSNLPKAIKAARKAHIPVIYEVIQGSDTEFHDEIRPESGDVIVASKGKTFVGSDLETALRSKKVSTLVLTGISPVGVVYRTERAASEQGYKVVVLGDCCSGRDPKENEIMLTRVLPQTSTVCSTNDFIAAIA